MHSTNKKAFFGDLVFEVCDDVYEPAEDSFLFAENLHVHKGSRVLDVGTGSGILGILAAINAAEVIAVDLSPIAILCAKENSKRNGVQDKISFLRGDLFTALWERRKFDFILFNAPYLPSEKGEDETWIGRAWAGGASGRTVIDRFISKAPLYLKKDGRILLLQSSLSNIEKTINSFAEFQFRTSVLAYLDLPFFERLVLLEATN